MRIVQLSTSDIQGGAARAAHRLAQGLRRAGHDCAMLVKQKSSADDWVISFGVLDPAREEAAAQVWKHYIHDQRSALSKTHFSLPIPGYDISAHPLIQSADIIHLHWVAGFLRPADIGRLQRLGKAVVWTLHDQRPFTGGCHYSAGCRQFETFCEQCPQLRSDEAGLVLAAFQEARAQWLPEFGVICLSRWMAECARQSAILGKARIEIIPNGLDTDVFRPGRAAARQKLGWVAGAIYFLFGADYVEEQRKGFAVLRAAILLCLKNKTFREGVAAGRINFVFFGEPPESAELGFPARSLGRIAAESALAEIYAAADAFMLPSHEDNLPNTMLEAMCCGTPVIGSAVGGIADTIRHLENGLLAPAGDEREFAAHMQRIVTDDALRARLSDACAQTVPAAFSLARQAERCVKFYGEEMTRLKPSATPPPPSAFVLPPVPPPAQTGAWRRLRSLF
ncbi:MAG TPA: glycosyltransferase [Verrucomicrobiae bacterium]|jgi:glycosyltransferase involved in cell wall biosynthesis|nr:glycosyltransferase [Verrucomicrobiae bacterium]